MSEDRLKPEFFRYPRFWRFNSSDFYVFYYAIGVVVALLMVLLFLVLLIVQQPAAVPSKVTPTVPAATVIPSTAAPSPTVGPTSSPTAEPTPLSSAAANVQARFDSAEQQPSYSLRAEAYEKLKTASELTAADRSKANVAYQRYHRLALDGQRQLKQALYNMNHERFTQAIRQFKSLIASGEIQGEAFLQAQQSLPKAYLKKIDYYLLKGKITLAHRALNEAKQNQVLPEWLAPYEEKIKNLEKAWKTH